MVGQPVVAPKRPGPPLWLSLPLLIGGVVLAIVSIVVFFAAIVHDELDAPTFSTPGSKVVICQVATYDLFSSENSPSVQTSSLVVSGPSGQLPVSFVSANETLTRNGHTYQAVLSFVVHTRGSYTVNVSSPLGSVIVAPDLSSETARNAGWIVGFLGGGLLGLIGLILLIVGLVRRSGYKKRLIQASYGGGYGMPMGPYPGSPPGWAPPGGPPGPPQQAGPPPAPQGWPQPQSGWQQPAPPPPGSWPQPSGGTPPSSWPQPEHRQPEPLPRPSPPPPPAPDQSGGWPQSNDQPGPPTGGLG